MAGRRSTYYQQQNVTPGTVVVEGSFLCAGAQAPSTVTGSGFTVGAPTAGIQTVTGDRGHYAGVVSAICTMRVKSSSSTKRAFFSDIVVTTDPWTATIVTQSTAGTAATASGAIVDFRIVFRDTQATK